MAVEFPGYKDNRVYFGHGLYGLPESHYSLPGGHCCHFTPLRLLDPRLRGADIVRAHRAVSSVIPAKAGIHK